MDEKQKHNVMELPPLPAPEIDWLESPGFLESQMREYGTQCALLASQPTNEDMAIVEWDKSLDNHIEKILAYADAPPSQPSAPSLTDASHHDSTRQVLENVRNCLERINNEGKAIADTLWYSDHETLFDYIDAELDRVPNTGTPKAIPRSASQAGGQAVDRDILGICDAYESGIGHGLQRDGHKDGSIFGNPEHGHAYEIGYAEGEERAAPDATAPKLSASLSVPDSVGRVLRELLELRNMKVDYDAKPHMHHVHWMRDRLDDYQKRSSATWLEAEKIAASPKPEQSGQAVPDGWQLVPKKLDGRCPLLMNSVSFGAFTREAAQRRWDAILAAAPKPPAGQE